MYITEQGLQEIEKTADKHKNVNLLFMVQILREVRELKNLLKEKQIKKKRGEWNAGRTN